MPCELSIREKVRRLIADAELICFPMGSFYSSIVANVLPDGVAEAIRANRCPKVYVPNMGVDPEQLGMSVADCVETLIGYMRRGLSTDAPAPELLDCVIVDSKSGAYAGPLDLERIGGLGVGIVDTDLTGGSAGGRIDAGRLISVLLSLC